ncbi:MAG: 2-phosphosulfolactate phosphatase family protein [Acaryochloridaceae cyanobacterium CSU_5_19]|nr:2-phosphosulfolactate phosphatase family protein [Acaryochloridaceae cyanobacterium CSU_5_19]
MKISVYHTPEEIPNNRLPNCAVVIDVLRASSTIVAALEAGATAVQVFSDIDQLLEASDSIPEEQRLRAGERGGKKVPSCELGNSPLAFTPEQTAGRQLFLSTTNGTRCSERVSKAGQVVIGSLNNRQAIANYLLSKNPGNLWLVGSGWEGSYSLEDTVCAGAIIASILANSNKKLSQLAGNDEAIAAYSLYQQWKQELPELLSSASHGQRLLKLKSKEDLEYCAQLDIIKSVPIQKKPGLFIERQPNLIEKTCEALGRLVGRGPSQPQTKPQDSEPTAPQGRVASEPAVKERVVAQAQPQAKPTKPQRSLSQPPEESSRPAVGVKKPTDQTDKPAAKTKPVPLSSTDSRPPVKSTPKTQPKPAQDPIAKADSSPAPELPEVVASGTVATLDKAKETITSAVAEIPTPIDSSSEVASMLPHQLVKSNPR